MPRCPHCGQQTSRTKDWACQWCGYPLLLKSYREIPMTYQELKEKGSSQEAMTVSERISTSLPVEPVTESEVEVESKTEVKEEAGVVVEAEAEVEEGVEAVVEAEVEAEAEEGVEAVVEAEAEPQVEEEAEAVVEVEPEPEPKPKRKRARKGKAKAKSERETAPEVEPVPEPEPESVPAEIAVTVEELQSAFADDAAGAEEKFVDKILKITGFVGRIAVNDIIDSPCVVLISSEKTVLRNVLCVFDKEHAPELKLLAPGQTVTVQGKYDSCTINILVTDCVLVS